MNWKQWPEDKPEVGRLIAIVVDCHFLPDELKESLLQKKPAIENMELFSEAR